MRRLAVWLFSAVASVFLLAPALSAATKPQAALAYTDPGSGAMIIQLLTTLGLMVAFYFSRARLWVMKRLGLGTNTDESQPSSTSKRTEAEQ